MSKSPRVVFKFENNNVQQTTPLLGVSCFLARTEKGPYDDPSVNASLLIGESHKAATINADIVMQAINDTEL